MLDFHPQSQRTDIGCALEYFTRVMKRHCTAFLISDFYDQKDYQHALQIANQKHDVVGIQVYDPRGKQLPDVGLIKVMDAETGHEMYIDTSSKKLRIAHAQNWLRRQNQLRQLFAKSKVDWTSIATNEDFSKSLLTLFKQRG